MHQPDQLFKRLLSELRPVFNDAGFKRASQNFTLQSDECWAVINFQKSRWSAPDEKIFYVNVAITPKRLMAFNDKPTDKAPIYYTSIWEKRAEQLCPSGTPSQWTLRDEESLKYSTDRLICLLSEWVIPAIRSRMSEAALMSDWKKVPTDYRQLKAKMILLAADGEIQELHKLLLALNEVFNKGATKEGVLEFTERLRTKFPDAMQSMQALESQRG